MNDGICASENTKQKALRLKSLLDEGERSQAFLVKELGFKKVNTFKSFISQITYWIPIYEYRVCNQLFYGILK